MDGPSFEYLVRTDASGCYDSAVVVRRFAVFVRKRGSTCIRRIRLFAPASPQQQHELLWEKSNDQKKKKYFPRFYQTVDIQFSLEGRTRGPWENVQRPTRGQQGQSWAHHPLPSPPVYLPGSQSLTVLRGC